VDAGEVAAAAVARALGAAACGERATRDAVARRLIGVIEGVALR